MLSQDNQRMNFLLLCVLYFSTVISGGGYDELKNEIINLNKRVVDYCTEYTYLHRLHNICNMSMN